MQKTVNKLFSNDLKNWMIASLLLIVTSCGWFDKKQQEPPLNRAQEVEHAQELEKGGDYRKAVISWQKLQKSDPENGYYLYHIGWNYSRLKEYARAEKFLKQSLEQDKENIDAMLALAYIYLWTDHFDQAQKLFSAVLERVPDYESAQLGLAQVKKREEAATLEKLSNEKKEIERTQKERADHFEREGDANQAILEWKKLLITDPDNAYYLYQIGRLYQKTNETQKAGEYLTRSLKLDPTNADTKVVLANVYRDLNNNEGAKILFKEVLKDHPNYEDAKKGLESVLKGERIAHEERLQEKAKQLQKDLVVQAEQLEKQDRFQEAIAIWVRLLDEDNDNAYYLYKIGQLNSRLKEFAKAERFLKKSVKINPANADAQLALGYVYLWTDDPQNAKIAFEQVLALVPDYQSAKEGLEKAKQLIAGSSKKKS